MTKDFRDVEFDRLSGLSESSAGRISFSSDENPLPLRRTTLPPNSYPIDALGDELAPFARKLEEASQAPGALCAQAALAVASLAAQGLRDVENDGRVSPLSECFVAIAESGERKTLIDRIATKPARMYEEELQRDYDTQMAFLKDQLAAYESARNRILKGKASIEEMNFELSALGPEPERPLSPVMLVEDPTYEGIVKLLEVGQPAIGLFSDEGGKLIGGVGLKEENRLKTATALSQFWDGSPITRTRAGDQQMLAVKMRGRRLAMSLMIQPVVARLLLSTDLYWSQGLLSRCLFTWPESKIGERLYREIDLGNDTVITQYNNRILDVFRAAKPLRGDKRNELEPPHITLGGKAKTLWIAFHNEIEREIRSEGKYAQVRGLGAKIPEHALRLAGILSVISSIGAMEISSFHIECGIELARYYLNESLRIHHESADDPDILDAEKLLAWLKSREDSFFHLAQIYQFGPGSIRSAKKARKVLGILEEHGHVASTGSKEIDGTLRKETWALRKFPYGIPEIRGES